MLRISVSLFGPLMVVREGEPVTRFATDKERALLIYLAAEADRPHRREALAAMLWGGVPEETALANFRRSLHRLRQTLGDDSASAPWLLVAPKTVQFNPAFQPTVDTFIFTEQLDLADAHQHRRAAACETCRGWVESAAALYRGDFLQGFSAPDSLEFDEWLVIRREQFRLRALAAFQYLAGYYARRGDDERVQQFAMRQVEMEPWRELAYRQLMTALARSGQRAAALAQFEACRRLLAGELGVEPEEQTVQLYQRIKRGERLEDLALPPSNLPSVPTSFVGREADLKRLHDRLQDPDCRLLTLTGPGGVGKTRLAIQGAGQQRAGYEHGLCFVSLASVRDAALLPDAIAQALGLRGATEHSQLEAVIHALREKELLLVLDNFEHLLEAATVVSELLRRCPQLSVLATSREPLRLTGEHLFPVSPLEVPALAGPRDLPEPTVLAESGAVRLFVKRVQAVRPGYELTNADSWPVVEICRRLDGLPLAIELAAARAEGMAPSRLAENLSPALQWLAEGPRDLPARQQTMRATIAWSYALLTEPEQVLWRRLAVFLGGCAEPAVASVAAESGQAPGALLASLVGKSLLQQSNAPEGSVRYSMLETLREYAWEQLAGQAEQTHQRQRHADYFLAMVIDAAPRLTSHAQELWLRRLELENDNLRAALGWYLEQNQAEQAAQLAGSLWRFWDIRGYLYEGRQWIEAALAQSQQASPAARARLLNGGGMLRWRQGDGQGAQPLFEAALAIWRELGDTFGQAIGLNNLALTAWGRGDYAAAGEMYEACLAVDRANEDRMGVAYSLGNLGLVAHHQGDFARAQSLFEASSALFRELGNRREEGFSLHNQGMTAYHLGDLALAARRFEASLAIKEELGDKWGQSITTIYLAQVARVNNDLERARQLLADGLALSMELGNREGVAQALAGLAALAASRRAGEQAARLFGAAEAVRQAGGIYVHAADRLELERTIRQAQALLSPNAFEAAWAEGQGMSQSQAVRYAQEAG